jgi:leucyl aminopeptidase
VKKNMRYFVSKTVSPSDCLIIGIFKDQDVAQLSYLSAAQQASLQAILSLGDFTGKPGQVLLQYAVQNFDAKRVILCGLGEASRYSLAAIRKSMQAVGKVLIECHASSAQVLLPKVEDDEAFLRQAIISLEDAHIRRDQLKTKPAPMHWPEKISFVGEYEQSNAALAQGEIIANAIRLSKDLANSPANFSTPKIIADRATEIAKKDKLSVEVYDKHALQELKMGCLLGVAQGSSEEPRMVVMRYEGAAASEPPIVLVGKGITFDSGGISLKPGARMDEMKYDMCGAASVIASVHAAAQLNLPINVIAVAVLAENMPSGNALKPGDVLTSMSGKTVEVLNTDAEGRLVLCDALTFVERFNPKAVINVATLTGAIIITLGSEANGLMGNNEDLIQTILCAGQSSGDRAWQLPLYDEYQELIDSAFADIANMGNNDGAKSIVAGCFLARFAEKYPWAHLDIAGTAWRGPGNMQRAATGRPVPLLIEYLMQQAQQSK